MIPQIDEQTVQAYFERLDPLVRPGTVLFVIGGSAIAQLGAPLSADPDELKALDEAAMLHLPLPEKLGVPARARFRLAIYQAAACDYGMRTFIGNLRTRLNRPPLTATEVPAGMVRDVVLTHYRVPEF